MEEDEAVPDHLRCNRTDGRQWRCKHRVKDNLKLCERHYLQGRHRQHKEKVPESLKFQRKAGKSATATATAATRRSVKIRSKKVEIMAKLMKKRKQRSGEGLRKTTAATATAKRLKRGNAEMELIRMVLKREVEKSNEKSLRERENLDNDSEEEEEELTRDLPNGLMAISSTSSSPSPGNTGSDSHCGVKVGAYPGPVTMMRRIRSKNVEALPIGKWQLLPCSTKVAKLSRDKRKKCHWCRRSGSQILTKCSSCEKQFFCSDCIKERYFDTQEEVKEACPVCRKTCTCKDCFKNSSTDTESKDFLGDKHNVEVVLCIHYLICMLLPVLKQINEDQNDELEIEARIKGKKPNNLDIKQAVIGSNNQHCCNKCKGHILDLHRSCPSCSYNLCLSCCRDLHQEGSREGTDMSLSVCSNKKKGRILSSTRRIEKKPKITKRNSSNKYLSSSVSLSCWTVHNASGETSCPPMNFGGCGESLLELRCLFPSSWTTELEARAEEIVCSYDFPDMSDLNSSCSLCHGTNQKAEGIKHLQEAAVRKGASDNFLYYPTLLEMHGDNVEHFQKHWLKGHPVIVRNVLKATSDLSWDPVVMFCTYLESSISRCENNGDLCEASTCLDWCEVEIGIRQCFMGSFKGNNSRKNTWNETLRLKGWLSSQLFKQQFPAHYAEIFHTLPLQEYMNPASGLLNLAARLPQGIQKPDLGPCLYISYGYAEQLIQADSVIKLHYDSFDMVNILAHTSDVPISAEQISNVRKLLKKHKAQKQSLSSKDTSDQNLVNEVERKSALPDEKIKDLGSPDIIGEEMHFRKKIATKGLCERNLVESNRSDVEADSDSDSENLLACQRTSNGSVTSEDRRSYGKKSQASSCVAQWDIFRRQDVSKLIEYLRRHSNEFDCTPDFHDQVVHPILDQSFFLDASHKMRLKQECKIEPWTFHQRVGEAVVVPAGCPYQIRSPKSCVHVVLDFLSPENVTECAQLADEIRQLPAGHKAKVDKLEVKKMALHSLSEAVKEIRELTCAT